MILQIISFGKADNNGYLDLEKNYFTKIKRFCEINIVTLKEETSPDITKNMRQNEVQLEKYMTGDGAKILLDFDGKQYYSPDFAEKISNFNTSMNAKVSFFIGPSDGFSQEFRARFSDKLSFGKATLPHQLARIVLLEQIYRSFKILNHEKYHK
jgi:23S rRNA (pseudouridine1915-N3)-methyltransferase